MFKRKSNKPQVAEREALEIMFHKMHANAQSLHLQLKDKVRCPILSVDEKWLFVGLSIAERERQGVRQGQSARISFYFEGKELFGGVAIAGAGRLDDKDALRLSFPASMTVNDDFCLTHFHLTPRKEIVFTSTMNQLCTGAVVNLGIKGVDIKSKESQSIKELLAVDRETQLGFELEKDLHFSFKGRVLYFQDYEEQLIGIEFLDADREQEQQLNQWIVDQTSRKQDKDRHFLSARKQQGSGKPARMAQSPGPAAPEEGEPAAPQAQPALRDDYAPVLKEGDPYILALSKDEELIARLGKCLMRKYGVLRSKGRFANVKELIPHYKPAMILVHERLGTVSGFDLAKTIIEHADQEQFIMVMGDAEDEIEKRNRAVRAGAVDYLVVTPFKTLPIFKKIDEMILE